MYIVGNTMLCRNTDPTKLISFAIFTQQIAASVSFVAISTRKYLTCPYGWMYVHNEA